MIAVAFRARLARKVDIRPITRLSPEASITSRKALGMPTGANEGALADHPARPRANEPALS